MEVIKDILKVEEQKGYEQIETLIETEIYLNQTKPDIDTILWADGKVEILSTKIIRDKILVNGLVKFKLVYKSQEEELNIYIVETNSDFNEEIEIQGITEEMAGEVNARIEYIQYEQVEERKINLIALINLMGKVYAINSVEIIQNIEGGPNLQVLKEKIRYNDVLRREESYAIIKDAFEIGQEQPSIDEILKIELHPYEKEYSISADRIILSGIVEASIIYFGGKKLNSVKREIPFTHFIDNSEIQIESKCNIDMEIVDGNYQLKESLEGDLRIIDLEGKLKISAKLYDNKEKEVIVDAYSTSNHINIEKEEIFITENVKDIISIEEISKELTGKGFQEVYAVEGETSIINYQYIEDKLMIEGVLVLNIYYLEKETEAIKTLREELPFKSYINSEELQQGLTTNIKTNLEKLEYYLQEDILSIQVVIKNHIFANRERKITMISEIQETDELIDKKNRPSIIIYMIQKDDTLWDIAKRYNTTVDEIVLANNVLSPTTLMPGEKIIIEKKVDINF